MREKLIEYVHSLFRDAPANEYNRDLEEEILQNSLDRFDDLIRQGVSPESAYSQTVSSIGSVRQLWSHEDTSQGGKKDKKGKAGWIVAGCLGVVVLVLLIGLAFALARNSWPGKNHIAGQDWDDRVESWADHVEQKAEGWADWIAESAGAWTEELEDQMEKWMAHAGWNESIGAAYYYPDQDADQVGAFTLENQPVRQLYVDWVDGKVAVEVYDGDKITVEETGANAEEEQLRWGYQNGRLAIRYCQSGLRKLPVKELLIRIPQEALALDSVAIHTVGADCSVLGMEAGGVGVETVSGSILVEGTCRKLDLETVSGDAQAVVLSSSVELDTVSGTFGVAALKTPDGLSFSGVSGGLVLELPEDRSFQAEVETISGQWNSEFSMEKLDQDTYRYAGEGYAAELELDTVSGPIELRKLVQ